MTRTQTAAFLLLCLWSSSTWWLAEAVPPVLTPIAGEGFRLLLMGACGLVYLLASRLVKRRAGGLVDPALAGISVGLVGAPFLLLYAARAGVASTTTVLVFSLMPLTVGLLGGTLQKSASDGTNGLVALPATLLAVAGIMILLPVGPPEGGAAWMGFGCTVASMLLSAVSMIYLQTRLAGTSLASAVASVCLANGVLLSVLAFSWPEQGWSFSAIAVEGLRCLLYDLPQTMLLIWLLKTIPVERLAARYVLAPLFTVLEGWAMLPNFRVRTLCGMALLGLGGFWSLRPRIAPREGLRLGR